MTGQKTVLKILSERNKGVTRSFGKNIDHGVTPDRVATEEVAST